MVQRLPYGTNRLMGVFLRTKFKTAALEVRFKDRTLTTGHGSGRWKGSSTPNHRI